MLDFLCRPLPFNAVSGSATAANVGSERLGRAAIFPAGTSSIDIDLGSSIAVDTFAAVATTLGAADTVTWVGASSQSNLSASPSFTSGPLTALASPDGASRVHRQHLWAKDGSASVRWIRLTISAAATVTVGRVVIGKRLEPLEGRDYGWERRVVDLGSNERSSTGLDDPIVRGKVLAFAWTWSGLTPEEADTAVLDIAAYAGSTRDLLCCMDHSSPTRHGLIGYGKLSDALPSINYAEGWHEVSCSLQSRLVLAL